MRLATPAMGTRFECVLPGDSPGVRAAAEAALELVRDLDRRWSRFDPSSVVSAINRAAGAWTPADRETIEMLAVAESVRLASGGAFSAALDQNRVGHAIELAADSVRIPAGTTLDLGGIAKGAALDLVSELFDELEIDSAFVHGGTSAILARGETPDGRPWAVRVLDADASPGTTFELRDECLCVSEPAPADRDAPHIVDARTGGWALGWGNRSAVAACALPRGRGALADAWATALTILAPDELDPATIGGRVWTSTARTTDPRTEVAV